MKYVEWGIEAAYLLVLCRIAYTDRKEQKIEPWTHGATLLLACLEILFQMGEPMGSRILGAGIISMPMLILTVLLKGGFGGGDIKLMGASGFLLGYRNIVMSAGAGIILGGVYAGYMLVTGRMGRKDSFALGPFLVMGIIGVKLWTSIS